MAVTIDDLHRVAVALREDVKHAGEEIVRALGGYGGGSGGGPGATPEKAKTATLPAVLDKITKSAAAASIGLGVFIGTFDRVIGALGADFAWFVELANPAAVHRFQIALENAMSAVGRILLPNLEQATVLIQQLGDALESLSPLMKQILAGLAIGASLATIVGVVVAGVGLVVAVLGGFWTVLIAVGAAITGIIVAMASSTGLLSDAVSVLSFAVRDFLEAIGLGEGEDKKAIAARRYEMSDLRSFANRAYTSALSSGGGMGTAERHLGATQESNRLLSQILGSLKGTGPGGTRIPSSVRLGVAGAQLGGRSRLGRGIGGALGMMAGTGIDVARTVRKWIGEVVD